MPGFPVLTTIQPIFGVDLHKAIPPLVPLMTPHPVVWGTGLSQKIGLFGARTSTSRAASPESGCAHPTLVGRGHACGRMHDAGPHPGHLFPNLLLPHITLGSSSKSQFGAGTVKLAVARGSVAQMAINAAIWFNPNIHCQDFPLFPLPTGLAFTTNYQVYAGFALTDLLHGVTQWLVDATLTWLVNLTSASPGALVRATLERLMARDTFCRALGQALRRNFFRDHEGLKGIVARFRGRWHFAAYGRAFVQTWRLVPGVFKSAWRRAPVDQVSGLAASLMGTYVAGTPVGYAPDGAWVGGSAPGTVSSGLTQVIDGLFQ